MASEGFHEPLELLSAETIEMHRAVQSIIEELEAADWYNQRVDATTDDDLRAILVTTVTRRRSTRRWRWNGGAGATPC